MTRSSSARVIDLAAARARAGDASPSLTAEEPPRRPPRGRFALWLSVSLLAHAAAFLLPAAWFERPEVPTAPRPLDVVLVTGPSAAPAAPRPAPAAPAAAAEPVPPPRQAAERPPPPQPRSRPTPAPKVQPRPADVTPPPIPAAAPPASPPAPVLPAESSSAASNAPATAPSSAAAAPPSAGHSAAPSGASREAPLTPPSLAADYLDNPPPVYPLAARRLGQSGLVVMRVKVSEAGKPTEVRVARSAGFEALDRAAVEAVRGWTFVPARRGDTAVSAWVEVPVRFRLEDAR